MSRIIRCDCCGVECVERTLHAHSSVVDHKDGGFEYEDIDCCPECTKRLQEFIYVLRHYPNNYSIHIKRPLPVTEEGDPNAV